MNERTIGSATRLIQLQGEFKFRYHGWLFSSLTVPASSRISGVYIFSPLFISPSKLHAVKYLPHYSGGLVNLLKIK